MERRRKHKSHGPAKDPDCCIRIYNRQKNLPISTASVRTAVLFFLREKKVDCKELAVNFVGTRKITELHGEFFQDPTPTDCITFPLDKEFLGEIFICPKAALEVNPRRPYEETTLYIFHCLLHLLGYDDINKKERARMRREEKRLMVLAKKQRCILETSS
jgi:probable rRNA maturation factor